MIYVVYILMINVSITAVKVLALTFDQSGLNLIKVEDMYGTFKKYIRIAVPIYAFLIAALLDTFFELKIVNLVLSYLIAIHFFDIALKRLEEYLLKKISE